MECPYSKTKWQTENWKHWESTFLKQNWPAIYVTCQVDENDATVRFQNTTMLRSTKHTKFLISNIGVGIVHADEINIICGMKYIQSIIWTPQISERWIRTILQKKFLSIILIYWKVILYNCEGTF